MRIAYYTDTFLPSVNGVVTVVDTLVNELADRGHEIMVVFPKAVNNGHKELKFHERVKLLPITSIPSMITPDLRLAILDPRISYQIRKFQPKIIHSHTPSTLGVQGILQAKLSKLPCVGSFHTYLMEPEYLKLVKLDRLPRVSNMLWSYHVKFFNRCNSVVVLSEGIREVLIQKGVKSELVVVPNGIDLKFIHSLNKKSKKKLTKHEGIYLLYVGRLSKEKSLDILLSAFEMVVKRRPDIKLWIVGDGPERKHLEELCLDLGIHNQVIFSGVIKRDILLSSNYFYDAHMFVTPSTSEVQPMSVIEAMAFGLPVVGVAARGMKDMVENGVNGILVDSQDKTLLAEAIGTLIDDQRFRSQLALQAKIAAQDYDLSAVVDKIESVYQDLLDLAKRDDAD